jgi:hypothetical protein
MFLRNFVRPRLWLVTLAILAIGGGVATYSAVGGGHSGAAPENLRALHSDNTLVPGTPPETRYLGPEYVPIAGSVHLLGHGALAWEHNGQVCWAADHVTGCDADLTDPISVTIGDSDVIAPETRLGRLGWQLTPSPP